MRAFMLRLRVPARAIGGLPLVAGLAARDAIAGIAAITDLAAAASEMAERHHA